MDRPLTLEERAEASRRFGAGVFSFLQRQRERERRSEAARPRLGEDENVIKIPIPRELMDNAHDKMGAEKDMFDPSEESRGSIIPSFLSGAVKKTMYPIEVGEGISEGFANAKANYYQAEKVRIRQELENEQKEYLKTLMHIRKHASTPAVDAFCIGIASTLDPMSKVADDPMGDSAVAQLLSDLARKAVTSSYSPVQLARPAAELATGAAVTPAMLAGYLTYNARHPRREEDPSKYNAPMQVQLQPY